MVGKRENKDKWIHVRVKADEFNSIQELWKRSVYRKRSEYLRRMMLQKPVAVYERNQSLDEFMREMIRLKNELNAIGNNFNQAVHRLHILETVQDYRTWVLMNETTKKSLFEKIDEIKNRIGQFSEKWLQSSIQTKA